MATKMRGRRLPALRAWRKKHGFTYDDAAKVYRCSRTQAFRYESGRRRIAAEKVALIEALTGVPRELLRPDIFRTVGAEEAAQALARGRRTDLAA